MFFALLKRDLVLEARRLEGLVAALFLSITVLSLLTVGLNIAIVPQGTVDKIAPVMMWVVLFVALANSSGRLAEYDHESQALEGLILAGASLNQLYLARVVAITLLSIVAVIVSFFVTISLLSPALTTSFSVILFLALLVGIGFAALAAVIGPISVKAKARGLLMPLLLLPLLFPLFFGAIELSTAVSVGEGFNFESLWLSLLVGLDAVYLALGLNLYPTVVRS